MQITHKRKVGNILLCIAVSLMISIIVFYADYKRVRNISFDKQIDNSENYFLAVTMESGKPGIAQVFFNLGHGYSDELSSVLKIIPDSNEKYLFPIKCKHIESIRFVPTNAPGLIKISNIHIEDKAGNIIQTFSLSQLKPKNRLNNLKKSNGIFSFDIPVDGFSYPVIEIKNSSFNKTETMKCNSWWLSFLIFIISILVCCFINKHASFFTQNFTIIMICFFSMIFTLLVYFGITGSSIQILIDKSSPIIDAPMKPLAFAPQLVRSDEWMVSTPWAIAQYNHKPQFPVVNTNIGIEGQNMLVIMNSIIPVKHISSLAKPATWGFFMLDLKRALSWNWFFPIFAGILSLWWMFYIVLNRRPITSFALSILFSISAYTVFWSTQVYSIISFAAISFCLAILILKNNKIIISSLLSIGLGLSIAGFILFLYPPWQISLAYLFLMIFIGVFLRDRLYSLISLQKILIYIIALAIVGILVWFWWIDSKNTIDIIRNTVYPGQRFRAGGTVPPLMLLRGFANMAGGWLLRPKGLFNIVPSYYYLFLPLTVVYFYILSKAPRKICYTLIPVALFSVFCMIYMFIGVPAFIAKYTLFYMVQGQRLNLALGLSYFFLCGIVFTNRDYLVNSKKYIILSYIISFLWVLIVLYIIIISKQELVWNTLLLSTVFLASYSLLTGNIKMFVVVYFFLNLPNLFFNPVAVAPDKFELKSNIENILFVNNDNTKAYRRVLALSNNQWPWDSYFPASLYAAGTPTVNGTFMYPQMKLWKKLDPDKKDINNYNRFQHLRFIAKSLPDHTNILIKAVGWGATVEVTVNAKSFNFDLTGAGIVVAPGHQYELLKQNTSLKFIKSLSGFTWFDVVKNNK